MLETQLASQQSQLEQLIVLLENERNLLVNQEIAALEELLQKKQLLLQHIADVDKEIADNSQEHILIKEGGSLYPIRLKLKQLLSDCKHKNVVNGKAIVLSLESNNRFSELLNNALHRHNITYDQNGKTKTAPRLGKGLTA